MVQCNASIAKENSEPPSSHAGGTELAPRLSRSSGGGHATVNAEMIGATEGIRCDRSYELKAFRRAWIEELASSIVGTVAGRDETMQEVFERRDEAKRFDADLTAGLILNLLAESKTCEENSEDVLEINGNYWKQRWGARRWI